MAPVLERGDPDWLHLAGDERVVWESRPHVVAMGKEVPIATALVLVGFVLALWSATSGVSSLLTLAGVVLILAGGVLALVRYVYWTNTRYVITTGELYKKRGVVSRDVVQFRLERVQNTSLEQSVLGRLLGYGELTVYTAGSGEPELTFERVPQPGKANRILSGELGGNVEVDRDPSTARS
ncbi:PH domain-containing protein [Natronobiforma cellulositropha]|uniref:PH domain-containing protein n=1 Tax=Natronobiforma cellulositropha TaxID=1679076 RepID=UPI0021D5F5F0|nr:PH domain-containing protein [Natronobiforma cellulositropha]